MIKFLDGLADPNRVMYYEVEEGRCKVHYYDGNVSEIPFIPHNQEALNRKIRIGIQEEYQAFLELKQAVDLVIALSASCLLLFNIVISCPLLLTLLIDSLSALALLHLRNFMKSVEKDLSFYQYAVNHLEEINTKLSSSMIEKFNDQQMEAYVNQKGITSGNLRQFPRWKLDTRMR